MSDESPPLADPAASAAAADAGARAWRRRFFSEWLPRAALESFLIVVSLLGALWLNSWNEDRQRDERVAEARSFIIDELRANHAQLTSPDFYPHHRKLRSQFEGPPSPDPVEADRARIGAVFATGVHPASFRDAAWRSVGMSDLLQYMEPREVFALADIYRRQEMLTEMNAAAYASLIGTAPNADNPREVRRLAQILRFYLTDVVVSEAELIEQQEQALKLMGAEPQRPAARR